MSLNVFWVVGLLACLEVRLPPLAIFEVPSPQSQQGWLDWLHVNTNRSDVLVHLPFPTGTTATDYEGEAWAMYWSLFHHRRIVNGYSGFFPPSYLKLKARLQHFPDGDSMAALQESGATYCVVPRSFAEQHQITESPHVIGNLELMFSDLKADVQIFRLRN